MKIVYSRHSKHRMKLYNISEKVIGEIISEKLPQHLGKHEIIMPVDEFEYPIKVIVQKEVDRIFIISAYPLKRGIT